ncbi:Hachiman antiphage defense system protein HamA [Pedobacter ghigonis]|uniref:Hachiman antiphage defense system protein HamA n=1 Tax=Pedobacter ghigonis TaxID=2730403 RepID=UPI0015882E70|nr:Hachiman antiphage defense system protein HamA [Pedobacter ghigonis]
MPFEDWSAHIKINRAEILGQLDQHYFAVNDKLALRLYTIRPSGTRMLVNGLCDALHNALEHFVYSDEKIKQDPGWAARNAGRYFGGKDPSTDGKYGELLLFVLVESVLGCKMVAHKLKSLSNFNDQVKGGDGIFIGNYDHQGKISPAYLIGESKVTATFGHALEEALKSLDRFYNENGGAAFLDQELIVAQEFIGQGHNNIDELYDRLTPTKQAFKEQLLVHPTLLMYSTAKYANFEKVALDSKSLSAAISKALKGHEKTYLKSITSKSSLYPKPFASYLDFFIIPCTSVNDFRNAMFEKIHYMPYVKPVKNGK